MLSLLAQTQLRNQSTVTLDVDLLQVLHHAAALTDHQQQTTVGMMILRMVLQVLVEVIDAGGEQRNLHLGGAGVALVTGLLLDDRFLGCLIHGSNLQKLIFANRRRHRRTFGDSIVCAHGSDRQIF